MNSQQQGFPQIGAPIAFPNGNVTQPWYQFFISLWNRTGAAMGNVVAPTGSIAMFGGATTPDGWLPCDGTPYSRTTYSVLYSIIGTTWGVGDGTTTFNVPDLRGKFTLGANDTYPLAESGGIDRATLNITNLPIHNHDVVDPGHIHTITDPGHHHTTAVTASNGTAGADLGATSGDTGDSFTDITIDSATTGVTTANAGGGASFSILPPYSSLNYIIKA